MIFHMVHDLIEHASRSLSPGMRLLLVAELARTLVPHIEKIKSDYEKFKQDPASVHPLMNHADEKTTERAIKESEGVLRLVESLQQKQE